MVTSCSHGSVLRLVFLPKGTNLGVRALSSEVCGHRQWKYYHSVGLTSPSLKTSYAIVPCWPWWVITSCYPCNVSLLYILKTFLHTALFLIKYTSSSTWRVLWVVSDLGLVLIESDMNALIMVINHYQRKLVSYCKHLRCEQTQFIIYEALISIRPQTILTTIWFILMGAWVLSITSKFHAFYREL